MNIDKLKDSKLWLVAAGAAIVPVVKKIVTSDTTRKFCVSSLAKGMKLVDDAKATVTNIKEDAADLCYEAKCTLETEEAPEGAVSDEV